MTAWKSLERSVASFFNTVRRKRGDDFSQSDVEVIADVSEWLGKPDWHNYKIIAECKYRTNGIGIVDTFATTRDKNKVSIGILGEDTLIMSLEDFKTFFNSLAENDSIGLQMHKYHIFQLKPSVPKYIDEFINQASEYSEKLLQVDTIDTDRVIHCLPLLCIAKRSRQGIFAILRNEDLRTFFKTKSNNNVNGKHN